MRRAIAVVFALTSAVCLVAQAKTPKIPKSCSVRDVLKDAKGNVIWLTHEQMKARATKMVPPKMSPLVNRTARIEGVVIVGVVVGADGLVRCKWLIIAHPILAQDVLEAVQQWEFSPQTKNGKPIAFAGQLDFQFKYGYSF